MLDEAKHFGLPENGWSFQFIHEHGVGRNDVSHSMSGGVREEVEGFLGSELGFCGCGNPEDALGVIREYLSVLKVRHDTKDWSYAKYQEGITAIIGKGPMADGLEMLVAYLCDDRKLSEHGGSVGGAWLTVKGESFLRDLLWLKAQEPANV